MSSKYLSAGLIFIATVIIGVVLVYPKYQAFRVSGRMVEDGQSELDSQIALINEVNRTESKYKKAEADLLKVADLLPVFNQKSVANLFVELESIASEAGVLIQTINFGSAGTQKDEKSNKGYKTINARMSIVSSYDAFKKFAVTIEKNQHLMDIVDVAVSSGAALQKKESGESPEAPETDVETRPEDQLFNYSVSLNAYYQ